MISLRDTSMTCSMEDEGELVDDEEDEGDDSRETEPPSEK